MVPRFRVLPRFPVLPWNASGFGEAVPVLPASSEPSDAPPPFPLYPVNSPKLGRGRGEIRGVEPSSLPLAIVPHQPLLYPPP